MAGSYKNKRVLVTGADGFMGSHLTERLLSEGAKVSVYVRGSSTIGTTQFALKNIKHLEENLEDILTGNIASLDAKDLAIKNRPEIIFHLAADAYVPNSFDHPIEVMETNVIGTLNMLHALKEGKGIKRLVSTSSSEIYGMTLGGSIDEEHPLYPSSPYAASKVAADRYCYSYWNTYRLPVSIIRPFNTYGPRHTYDVIPKFISLALKDQTLTVHGRGKQSRDFTYVDDMVDAFLIMGAHPRAIGKAVNFGTGKAITINYIARKIKELSESRSRIIHVAERQAQVPKLLCNYSLANKLFGWRPKIFIDEGLRRNIEWAKENRGC
ncbi:MAG TPA: GDP-mannose 4,6-dehydratase [Candidatus Margulisiibacteriota bacterium]|nr:GDP-mannose 4,6-dehydratase [Candidatus Margulisiibacteriota bacterium]